MVCVNIVLLYKLDACYIVGIKVKNDSVSFKDLVIHYAVISSTERSGLIFNRCYTSKDMSLV